MIKKLFFVVSVILIGYPAFSQNHEEIIRNFLDLDSVNNNAACYLVIDEDSKFGDFIGVDAIWVQDEKCNQEILDDADIFSFTTDTYLIDETVVLKDISTDLCLFVPIEDIITVFLYFDEDKDCKEFVNLLGKKYE